MAPDTRDTVIAARRLSKTVGRDRLVDEVSFTVDRGDVYVLVGVEGSGKSTIARMLVGLTPPTTGDVTLFDTVMGPAAYGVFDRTGFLPDEPVFRGGLTARQELTAVSRLRGHRDDAGVARVLDRLRLAEVADERTADIGDDRSRLLGLARAVISGPELLVLDEPTRGLGRRDRQAVIELVRELSVERGVTVCAFSHASEGMTDVASRLAVLHAGRLVDEFDRGGLRERGRAHIEVVVSDAARAARVLESGLGMTDFAICQEGLIRIYVGADQAGIVNTALAAEGITVTRLQVNEGSLQELLQGFSGEGGHS